MNSFEEQLRALREIGMPESDRARTRDRLASAAGRTFQPNRVFHHMNTKRTVSLLAILGLLASASVSYAAEGSAPGDTLYPIKIHVNESVRSAVARSDEDRAKLEADLAERRLVEAELLARRAALDDEKKALLRSEFESHRSRADDHLRSLSVVDATGTLPLREEFDDRFDRRGRHGEALRSLEVEFEDGDDDRGGNESEIRGRESEGEDHSRGGDRGRESDDSRGSSTSSFSRGGGDDQESELRGREEEGEDHERGRGRDDEEDEDDDEDDRRSGSVTPPPTTSQGGPTTSPVSSGKSYTLAEVALHASQGDCYSAISGSVYNLTPFLSAHPGGSVILSLCGKEGTSLYLSQHSMSGKPGSSLSSLRIGALSN